MFRPEVRALPATCRRFARQLASAAARHGRRLWSRHCRLLRENAAYAATVAAAAAAAVNQVEWHDLVAVVASAALSIWLAVRGHRGMRTGPDDQLRPWSGLS